MRKLRPVTAAFAVAVLCATGTTAAASPTSERPEEGDRAFVDVTVTTLWTEPDTARDVDEPSLTNPVDLDQWNENMEDTETRGWLTGKLESQAVLGSEVQITEVSGDWAHIVVPEQSTPDDERGYPGWVPIEQLVENEEFAQQVEELPSAQVTADRAWLTDAPDGDGLQEISFNTELPVLETTEEALHVALPDSSTAWLDSDDADVHADGEGPDTPDGQDLVRTGEEFLGLRYLWAGVSAFGYDCSGFTYSIYRAHGISVPRDSSDQATTGTDVEVSDLQAGDLLFFAEPGGEGQVHHVGMYIGNGEMIHAPNASTSVSIVDWDEWDSDDEFSGAKRVL